MTRLVSPTIPREEDVHGEKKKKKKKKFERGTGYEKRRRRDETHDESESLETFVPRFAMRRQKWSAPAERIYIYISGR